MMQKNKFYHGKIIFARYSIERDTAMIKRNISGEWLFCMDNGQYETVDLPHDYAISQVRSAQGDGNANNGFFPTHNGRYVKYLSFQADKHYTLDIDGAYMNTQIMLNAHYLAKHPYGYTPFLVDLTPWIRTEGTNKLVITTDPLPASCRWYSGSGIFRDVFLWEGGDVRIGPWDMFISTAGLEENQATIRFRFAVTADRSTKVKIRFTVAHKGYTKTDSLCLSVPCAEQEYFMTVEDPQLWEPAAPHLYTLKTEILEGETLLDTAYNTFGIRTVSADPQNGLLLNGKPIKLRGGCIHHDHGVLGAAAFPAAEERKIRLLQQAGFNAVRTAHNPPSLALLECCDRMGMILMDEAFDVWNKQKRPNDYHWFFEDWYARDISYMVRRDRNHPCVFSYSIGNEILEIDGTSNAGLWSKRLVAEVKKHDDTKLVTSGVHRNFVNRPSHSENIDPEDYKTFTQRAYSHPELENVLSVVKDYEEPLDIIGLNYHYQQYEQDHMLCPNHVIWGSETKVLDFYKSWKLTRENPYILGDFTWTAFDNLGEVGAGRGMWARDGVLSSLFLAEYPWRSCYQGDLDLCGYRRPQSYFREAVWLGGNQPRIFVTHPEHYGESYSGTGWHWPDVNECWTYDDRYVGRPITAETYTDAEKVCWFVNDEFVGESVPREGIAKIDTVYQKGTITAVAYCQGVEQGRYTLSSTGPATAIDVKAEKPGFIADRRDLCYFAISITDAQGRLITDAGNEICCTVMGGELMGIFSGNPCNEDSYTSDRCHVFKGRALAVVRTGNPGTVRLKVFAQNLASGYVEVTATEA